MDFPIRSDQLYILDGGLGFELENQLGRPLAAPLWSAECLLNNPELIRQVHLDYLFAGADIVTSSSYQASEISFAKACVDPKGAENYLKQSNALVIAARQEFLSQRPANVSQRSGPFIAVSLGCYGASMGDGSEYHGVYGPRVTKDVLKAFHQQRILTLLSVPDQKSELDLLVFETIPNVIEIAAILELLEESFDLYLPAMISLICKDERCLSSGEDLQVYLENLNGRWPELVCAVGINCTKPQYCPRLVKLLRDYIPNSISIACYPNNGNEWDPVRKVWVPSNEQDYLKVMLECRRNGANILGGTSLLKRTI